MQRPLSLALLASSLLAGSSAVAEAQCCGYAAPAPTVAYSPVVAQTTYRTPWYPGRWFAETLFGAPRTQTGAVVTAGYAPAYAGVAPVASVQTAYRPVYPATFGPVTTASTYVARPVIQTVSRPVVLTPTTVSACSPCTSCVASCDPCGASYGVSQAGFASSTCSSCASGGATYLDSAPATTSGPSPTPTPQPALGPNENPPAERSLFNKPEVPNPAEDAGDAAAAGETGAFWEAPPLFDPNDRLTQRNPAPVRFAVDRRPAAPAAGGWISVSQ